jgi:S1-C subfamily serine protease
VLNQKVAVVVLSAVALGGTLACSGSGSKKAAPLSRSVATAQSTAAAPGSGAATGNASTANTPAGANPVSPAASINRSSAPLQSTADVVKALRPSVVRVRTAGTSQRAFGVPSNTAGTGTGIVIDDQGHILTNNHVVTLGTTSPSNNISVDFADGQSVTAQLVGREPIADLAILKVDAKNLVPAKLADPKTIEVGQDVVAIGYALDLGATPSVTKGVISGLNREIDETLAGGTLSPGTNLNVVGGAIQTDAAINPGNSGGPLVNMAGEVVGINTAVLSSRNGQPVQGINFAVSVETASPVIKALIDKGKVDRGYLGVLLHPITPDEARAQQLPVSDGVGIQQLTGGSAAEQAGLKEGDIIVKAGNRDIHGIGDMQQALIENGPGTKLHVEYYRGSAKQSADVTLATRPAGV